MSNDPVSTKSKQIIDNDLGKKKLNHCQSMVIYAKDS